MAEKRTEPVKVWLTESEFLALNRMAISDDRKLSDFLGIVLHQFAFGHSKPRLANEQENE